MDDFYIDGVLITTINPEAIPAAQKNLAKLIIKLAEKELEKQNSTI
jgi:hypothetical protein